MLLSVPDSAGRYYVLQFVDAWTNNFAYVGKRATGTGARDFLLLPPDWEGDGIGGCHGDPLPDPHRHDRRAVGVRRRRRPARRARPAGRDDAHPAATLARAADRVARRRRARCSARPLSFYEKLRLYSQAVPAGAARRAAAGVVRARSGSLGDGVAVRRC